MPETDDVRGGKWADRDLFPLDADVTVYWPDVRPCYDAPRTRPIPPDPVLCPCTRWDYAKDPNSPGEHPWEPGEGKCPDTPPPGKGEGVQP